MAKYKRRGYYRYYKRKKFNNIAKNYAKARFDWATRIQLTSQYIRFSENTAAAITVYYILNNCPDYNSYKQLYQSFKITGLAVDISSQYNSDDLVYTGIYAFGLLTDADGGNLTSVVESDRSLILSPTGYAARRYWSMRGGSTGWLNTQCQQHELPGKFALAAQDFPNMGECYWTIKFSIYCLFKNKN